MTAGWVLVGIGILMWSASGPLRKISVSRSERRVSHEMPKSPLWIGVLNLVGLACVSIGAILLIGWMFTQVDPELLSMHQINRR